MTNRATFDPTTIPSAGGYTLVRADAVSFSVRYIVEGGQERETSYGDYKQAEAFFNKIKSQSHVKHAFLHAPRQQDEKEFHR